MRVKAIDNFLVAFKEVDGQVTLDEKGRGTVCFAHRKYDFKGEVTEVPYDPADDSSLDAVISGINNGGEYLEGCAQRLNILHTSADLERVLAK